MNSCPPPASWPLLVEGEVDIALLQGLLHHLDDLSGGVNSFQHLEDRLPVNPLRSEWTDQSIAVVFVWETHTKTAVDASEH